MSRAVTEPPTAARLVTPVQYLRQLSFDLRGRPPTAGETDRVAAAAQVPGDLIDQMLKSPDFLSQVDAWHSELLWPNVFRYRPQANGVAAFTSTILPDGAMPPVENLSPYALGTYWIGSGAAISPDPRLMTDTEARNVFVVAVEDESYQGALRGAAHAYPTGLCDIRADAEYPDPSVVGTPKNQYVVPARRSGNGKAFTGKYYSEDPATFGAVLPFHDYTHCENYCRRVDCSWSKYETRFNQGPTAGCFRDMDTPGDDPAGRHELDLPGMRCPDGYVREVNSCDFWNGAHFINNGAYFYQGLDVRETLHALRRLGGGTSVYGAQREGWRWMEHYWSQGQKVKTCALDAQERETGLYRKTLAGKPIACAGVVANTRWYTIDPSCGCGPKGAYCQPVVAGYRPSGESRSEVRLRSAIEREPLRIVRSIVDRDEDYLTILTTKRSFVNGPLAFAWRYQATALRGEGFLTVSPPAATEPAWDKVPYESESWVEYQRPARHAGVLTTLGFLLRFPTYRSRVAQYRRAFLCSPEFDFAPQPDPADTNPDIARRSGCASCHQRLENDGLWFGRYPDRTPLYLDPADTPVGDKYFEDTFKYQDKANLSRLDRGPEDMVRMDLAASDAIETCTVRTAWARLVRREIGDLELKQLTGTFSQSGRKYRELVRAIVTNDAYRSETP